MAFRFRRPLRLARGLKLNIGKRGASLSVGGPGNTVNVSKRGVAQTLGIPGTGISYQHRLSGGGVGGTRAPRSRSSLVVLAIVAVATAWFLFKAL